MLPTPYQSFIHLSRYSRYLDFKRDSQGHARREFWSETVCRYFDFMEDHLAANLGYILPKEVRGELEQAVLNLEVMPSMRALMTAGPALEREHLAGYNCAFVAIDNPFAFAEILYILMCGTGVGFSVERQIIKTLPECPKLSIEPNVVITVEDSKGGWSKAYDELINYLFQGVIPSHFDVSKVRPAGARLKTFGGRASGPKPLLELFHFTISKFKNAVGRRLTSLEIHDIATKIGDIVVVGGVRRSAMLSLSNLSDDRMREAKSGNWYETEPQRRLANNSVAYTEKPEVHSFMKEWLALYESKSGERGIFSRYGAIQKLRDFGRRNTEQDFGTNPCGEILLRSQELCNLTECVIRSTDTVKELLRKIKLATILGTFQSTLTNFNFVNKNWALNCNEEHLLGVSLTGIMDNVLTNGKLGFSTLAAFLEKAKAQAIATNKEWSRILKITESVAITTVKPSGTVSQLVMAGSGIHPWHDKYYIRTVRADNKDPLAQLMKDMGIINEPCISKPDDVTVFSFPTMAPEGAVLRDDISAIQHMELAKLYNDHWTEHNTSITVTVRDHEWPEVSGWIYRNFDSITGMSFLPHSDHVYAQAPYQSISEFEYKQLMAKMPTEFDWTRLPAYESGEDMTHGSQTLACTGNVCEIVDIDSSNVPARVAT